MYISAINILQQTLEFQLEETASQQEQQRLLQEHEQDKAKVIGQADKTLQTIRVAFPNAGYYRTSDYDFG